MLPEDGVGLEPMHPIVIGRLLGFYAVVKFQNWIGSWSWKTLMAQNPLSWRLQAQAFANAAGWSPALIDHYICRLGGHTMISMHRGGIALPKRLQHHWPSEHESISRRTIDSQCQSEVALGTVLQRAIILLILTAVQYHRVCREACGLANCAAR